MIWNVSKPNSAGAQKGFLENRLIKVDGNIQSRVDAEMLLLNHPRSMLIQPPLGNLQWRRSPHVPGQVLPRCNLNLFSCNLKAPIAWVYCDGPLQAEAVCRLHAVFPHINTNHAPHTPNSGAGNGGVHSNQGKMVTAETGKVKLPVLHRDSTASKSSCLAPGCRHLLLFPSSPRLQKLLLSDFQLLTSVSKE